MLSKGLERRAKLFIGGVHTIYYIPTHNIHILTYSHLHSRILNIPDIHSHNDDKSTGAPGMWYTRDEDRIESTVQDLNIFLSTNKIRGVAAVDVTDLPTRFHRNHFKMYSKLVSCFQV